MRTKPTKFSNTVERTPAPELSGVTLRVLALLLYILPMVSYIFAANAGLFTLRKLKDEEIDAQDVDPMPVPKPGFHRSKRIEDAEKEPSLTTEDITSRHNFSTGKHTELLSIADLHKAFVSKSLTPTEVAEKIITILGDDSNTLSSEQRESKLFRTYIPSLIRAQAAESAARYAAGAPRSVIDGIPVAVKNQFDIQGHTTYSGLASFSQLKPAVQDADVVKRLRDAGAVILGGTHMTEVGWSPTDVNVRNAFDARRSGGGSSSGSAVAVATGICPMAVGGDGGGSIRIPSAFNGLYGLKPTHGRICSLGMIGENSTVAVGGPIGATIDDVSVAYLCMAGPNEKQSITLAQPPVHIPRFYHDFSVRGLRIGIPRAFVDQVQNASISSAMKKIERELLAQGAEVIDIVIPYLDVMRWGFSVSICTEVYNSLSKVVPTPLLDPYCQVMMCVSRHLTAADYIAAAKVRSYAKKTFQTLFADVNAILLPTTAITAPKVPQNTAHSWSNTSVVADTIQFTTLANYTGCPALQCPVGLDTEGMPVGLQFMGEWWSEGLLLCLGKWMEGVNGRGVGVRGANWNGVEILFE